jgi:hypothetical protein
MAKIGTMKEFKQALNIKDLIVDPLPCLSALHAQYQGSPDRQINDYRPVLNVA